MKYGIFFLIVAVLLAAIAVIHRGWWCLLLWPALSFGVVALGYLLLGARVFGKSESGLLSPINQLVLLPYLVYLWSIWYLLRLVRHEPPVNQLTEKLFIGRRLFSTERPDNIDYVIDLTCEFNEPNGLRSGGYFSYPILDGLVPPLEQLNQWIEQTAALDGTILIHCAEGHGRTGMFAAMLLVYLGHSQTTDAALQLIQTKRPLVRLNSQQLRMLKEIHSSR
ncbi:dual specificity protein phosphatase family protein [Gimesia aquarii]|uniref:protein-tyrosine-phosphatase n=1 Tax=Gimesia aquarii TaxID=2527964 RepID=A0A517W2B1_9PLAN|nr:dual specificity protein phosphatase family protein [Gimesia aquarii]QDT99392.1 hypothetical protein V144x_49030 [Gimesia aquarii]